MSRKKMILIGMTIGSIAGGYLPSLFGPDEFSITSILAGILGGIVGTWIAYRFTK